MPSKISAESFDPEEAPTGVRMVPAHRMRDYDVVLVDRLANPNATFLSDRIGSRRALVVTTPSVARFHADAILQSLGGQSDLLSLMVLPCTESTKALDLVTTVCNEALRCGLDRKAVLVGLGGGVCTDIVTMAASWIRRGIGYIKVPTTLIGLVDSGIGIKGAVNFAGKKSYLGCFYPPESVLLEPAFLSTLPERHIRSGLAEIIKTALVCDPLLFALVEGHWQEFLARPLTADSRIVREIVWRSTVRMLDDLEPNLYEDQTQERLSDLGHTFSPALESASGFSILHGEAVAVDMALSACLAMRLGLLDPVAHGRILRVLQDVGLPLWLPVLTASLCRKALEEAALHRGGRPNLVLPVGIGETAFIRDLARLSIEDLDASIELLRAAC